MSLVPPLALVLRLRTWSWELMFLLHRSLSAILNFVNLLAGNDLLELDH